MLSVSSSLPQVVFAPAGEPQFLLFFSSYCFLLIPFQLLILYSSSSFLLTASYLFLSNSSPFISSLLFFLMPLTYALRILRPLFILFFSSYCPVLISFQFFVLYLSSSFLLLCTYFLPTPVLFHILLLLFLDWMDGLFRDREEPSTKPSFLSCH